METVVFIPAFVEGGFVFEISSWIWTNRKGLSFVTNSLPS